MKCNHELYERETACVDGACPLCAAAEIAELTRQRELLRSQFVAADVAAKAERLLLIDARAELEQVREALQVITEEKPAMILWLRKHGSKKSGLSDHIPGWLRVLIAELALSRKENKDGE